eukprot:199084-Prorocentrum_minimum.AAC.1
MEKINMLKGKACVPNANPPSKPHPRPLASYGEEAGGHSRVGTLRRGGLGAGGGDVLANLDDAIGLEEKKLLQIQRCAA